MKAKEMFEKLGYEICKEDDCILEHKRENDKYWTNYVTFAKFRNYYIVTSRNKLYNEIPSLILPNVHQAIHQQMKELGWLDEQEQF